MSNSNSGESCVIRRYTDKKYMTLRGGFTARVECAAVFKDRETAHASFEQQHVYTRVEYVLTPAQPQR